MVMHNGTGSIYEKKGASKALDNKSRENPLLDL